MLENSSTYLADPKKYCSRINTLLEQNSKEWQTVWNAAIPELSNLASNELSVINSLLKPIEKAFKSKDGQLRVQAFECWSHFITHCDKIGVSDKLWNVLLIPLLAHNHSQYCVLEAKLKTWDIFVDTEFHTKPNIRKRAIPALLMCLYGPHPLDRACNFTKLSEICGQLYRKMLMKCAVFEEMHTVLSYLENAVPPLSNFENTQKLAKLIWNEALRIINERGWQMEHFKYLMRTLENLFSDDQNDAFQLISNFLAILFDIHNSFPPDRLTPHLNSVVRCLFHPTVSVKVVYKLMNSILKLCEKPSFFFHEVDKALADKIKNDRTDADVLWIALATNYAKLVKNNGIKENDSSDEEFATALKILLFPFNHMSEICYETERFESVMKHWKLCYEECANAAESETFLQVLLKKLEDGIDSDTPRLMVATFICNVILTIVKFAGGFVHMKGVLLKISRNMPDIKQLTDSKLKSFAVKYIITVKAYVQFQKSCWEDFSHVIKSFNHLLPKDIDEIPKSDVDKDSSSKRANEGDNSKNITTPTVKRTSFLERLKSPATKRPNLESSARSQTTPKTSKIDDDDIQFVEVKPRSKNSPMTQHQLEKAKSKRYIPALYQDLSQSHSQSLSQSESESVLSGNRKLNTSINPELFEENANLPAISGDSSRLIVPSSLSFHTGLNSPISDKSSSRVTKKSLFNYRINDSEQNSDSDSSVEVISENKPSDMNKNNSHASTIASDDIKVLEKQTTKRKSLKENEIHNEITPIKRSKRISCRTENNTENKSCPKSRKSTSTPISAQKPVDKSKSTNDTAHEAEVIDLAEAESQNVFVNTNGKTANGMSSPLNSLMNLRDANDEGNGKRKSLRSRRNSAPNGKAPITTRKNRTSVTFELDSNKITNSDDLRNEKKSAQDSNDSKQSKLSNLSPVQVTVANLYQNHQFDFTNNSSIKTTLLEIPPKEITAEKESTVAEKTVSSNIVRSPNDSVVLVENEAVEVISIQDSESLNSEKKSTGGDMIPSLEKPSETKQNSSDESTFYEGSEQVVPNKDPSDGKNPAEVNVPPVAENVADSVAVETPIPHVSPEVISSADSNCAKRDSNVLDVCTSEPSVETNAIEDNLVSSASILENSRTSASNESVCNLQSLSEKENANVGIIANDTASNDDDKATSEIPEDHDKTENNETSLPSENCDKQSKSNEDNNYRREKKDDCENVPTIHGNSRGSQLTKLAQGSNYLINSLKPAKTTSPKPGKSPRSVGKSQVTSGNYPSPKVSRPMKILYENKLHQTTPTKSIIVLQEESRIFTYTPKECTSPGILKKIDANQSNSSPKSPKFVNFADEIAQVRYFDEGNDSDSDSLISTGDKLSNENLLDNDQLKSQDMLYSPLHNCRDNIRDVLDFLFHSGWREQGEDFFQRIGINTVGQLASVSTLTASSIPAGDNRIKRLKRALKKYDRHIESTGRRRPSARRRILKSQKEHENREVTCLLDLLNEVDLASNNSTSDDEEENDEPLKETLAEEDAANTSFVAQELSKNETENDETPHANKIEESVIVPSNEPEEPTSKSTELPNPVIENSDEIDSCKNTETEIVETENKDNVDPRSDSTNAETAPESNRVEPMEVDELVSDVPKTTNDTINESADYVCTDSNAYEQDITDKRCITMNNIRRYSTVIQPNNEEIPNELLVSTEIPSTETISVINKNDGSASESVSIFSENKIVTRAEKIIDSQETFVDSQETSVSVVESVIVIPSSDRDQHIVSENNINTVVEKMCNEVRQIVFGGEKLVPESKNVSIPERSDKILTGNAPFDTYNEKNTSQKSVFQSQPNDRISAVAEGLPQEDIDSGVWLQALKKIYHVYEGDGDSAKRTYLKIVEEGNSVFSTVGWKLQFCKVEKK